MIIHSTRCLLCGAEIITFTNDDFKFENCENELIDLNVPVSKYCHICESKFFDQCYDLKEIDRESKKMCEVLDQ